MDSRLALDFASLLYLSFGAGITWGVTWALKRVPRLRDLTQGQGSAIASCVSLAIYGAVWWVMDEPRSSLLAYGVAALASANLATTGNTVAERVSGRIGRGETP